MASPITLDQLPAVIAQMQQDISQLQALRAEMTELRARLPKWMTDEQAQQITGLSRDTLRRHRQAAGSVIIHQPTPLRYDYDSLLAHNALRSLGRCGRLANLLASAATLSI